MQYLFINLSKRRRTICHTIYMGLCETLNVGEEVGGIMEETLLDISRSTKSSQPAIFQLFAHWAP